MLPAAAPSHAFYVDDLATPAECAEMVQFARELSVPGGGYNGDADFLGKGEYFQGVNVVPTHDMPMPTEARVKLIVMLDRMKRALVEHYDAPTLRCGMASLAWRQPVSGMPRGPLSHPFHCDHNTRDADAWRRYSAVLILNEDFGGGELCFPLNERGDEAVAMQNKVGRMVAFDGRNPHGVTSITHGSRFSLVGWFGLYGPDHPALPPGHLM